MYNEKLDMLIDMAIADGEISETEKKVLYRNAQEMGIDLDEFEMILQGKLFEKQRELKKGSGGVQASTKIGGPINKCPACGAVYIPGTAICGECGHVFSNLRTSTSYERLYKQLAEFNSNNHANENTSLTRSLMQMYNLDDGGMADIARRKMDIIHSFPVPNDREDLIDLLSALQAKSDPNGPKNGCRGGGPRGIGIGKPKTEDLSYAYWLLYSNCINKARISFLKDKDFQPFFSFYEERLKSVKSNLFRLFK